MRIVLSWSGGKDSVLMLRRVLDGYDIVALMTAVLDEERKVVMHEVPEILIERQASALNLRWQPFYVPRNASNAVYEKALTECLSGLRQRGVERIAFGDIFLEDIRAYRERLFAKVGMQPLFPLWKLDSRELALEFIGLGFKAITVCVDSRALEGSFVGQLIDEPFLQRLPAGVDPCGENGEFHSFVFDGPQFAKPVTFTRGDTEKRDDFYFCQLIPD